MSKSDLVCVGAIAGAHGVQGEVRVRSFTLVPEDCFAYGPLLDETGAKVLEAKSYRPAKNHFVVVTKETDTREAWEAARGNKLYVPKSALPEPDEDEFYYDDLVGMHVTHEDGRALGRVKAVQNFGADDLLEIVSTDNKTAYYLPFTKEMVPSVQMTGRQIIAAADDAYLPEDLRLAEPDQD